ncbi:hypothetical protein D915_000320 [Fasciola hepatica]|uniref:Ionotropic glutamate receptor C-terminal domain-containing protein n=1 Tax=Fasciola hepatica TaxID=6192 RepID=A0A4E0RYD2_FASHE|nr:hypothetical protein D915_000320 [Fasciola hepatica]
MYLLAFSARTLALFYWFLIIMWHANWEATMTALYAQSDSVSPVPPIKEIFNQEKIRPLVLHGSSDFRFFQDSRDNPVYSQIYQMLVEDNITIYNTHQALDVMRNNLVFALISDRYLLHGLISGNRHQFILSDEIICEHPARFAVPRGADYGRAFANFLEKLADGGNIQHLFDKWLPSLKFVSAIHPEYTPIDVDDLGGEFLPLILGLVMGLTILSVEYFWIRYGARNHIRPDTAINSNGIQPALILDLNSLRFAGRRRSMTIFNAETIGEGTVIKTRL